MRISDIQSFSEALRSFRERTRPRISQQRLADTLDVHRQTIVAWERGDYLPKDRGFVLEIAKCLHLSDEETDVLLKAALLDIPSPPWHVPYHQNPFFTGRQEALHYLHHTLQPGTTAALTQPQAISGLGGIGKTQVALEYAYRHRQDYQAVLWLQASTSEILFSEFVKLAQVLNLPEQNEQDQTHAVNAVRRWLKGHRKWLLILDDLEDLLLLQEFLPPGHHGCVLLTTRVAVTEPVAQVSELATMTEQEGILFLLRRTKVLLERCTESLSYKLLYF